MGWMLVSIGLGGALGAISRYLLGLWVVSAFGQTSSWLAIIFVNVAGCFLMGVMAAILTSSTAVNEPVRGFVMIGFLGALTTFSSFALDMHSFFQRAEMVTGGVYLLASVFLSVAGFYAGFVLLRLLSGQG